MSSTDAEDELRTELDLLSLRMQSSLRALRLAEQQSLSLSPSVPVPVDLRQYFPQSVAEAEVQAFNLYADLPLRLTEGLSTTTTTANNSSNNTNNSNANSSAATTEANSDSKAVSVSVAVPVSAEEALTMWILEREDLRRDLVSHWLLQSSLLARNTLLRLLSRICALEAAQGFVEGLRYTLVVTGLWEQFCALREDEDTPTGLRTAVALYVQTHFSVSKRPLLPLTSLTETQANTVLEIAFVMLHTLRVLQRKERTVSVAMAEFSASLREISKRSEANSARDNCAATGAAIVLSNKAINEMFNVLAAHPIAPLRVPAHTPSCLFAHTLRHAHNVSTGFDDDYQQNPQTYSVRLGRDTLFFFSQSSASSSSSSLTHRDRDRDRTNKDMIEKKRDVLKACVPLHNVHAQRCSYDGNRAVIELFDLQGERVPWILFTQCTHTTPAHNGSVPLTYTFPAPCDRQLYERVVLDFSQARDVDRDKESQREGESESVDVESWIDALEHCCWSSRSRS